MRPRHISRFLLVLRRLRGEVTAESPNRCVHEPDQAVMEHVAAKRMGPAIVSQKMVADGECCRQGNPPGQRR